MPDGVSIKMRRKDALLAKLTQLAPAAGEALTKVNGDSAEEMASLARSYAPKRTGKLAESIVVTPPGGAPPDYSQGIKAVPAGAFAVTAGNKAVRYAHLVEYGTSPHTNEGVFKGTDNPGAPRQPFFWPAYRLIRKKMRSRAARALNKAAKDVAK